MRWHEKRNLPNEKHRLSRVLECFPVDFQSVLVEKRFPMLVLVRLMLALNFDHIDNNISTIEQD